MKEAIIFLSHANADKELTDQFKSLLVMGLDLRQSDIFYTSNNATGVPVGADGNQYMQEQLKGAKIIISLITPSFYDSAYCMCELGFQSHLKDVIVFPIVFPYSNRNLISDLVESPSLHHINHRKCLDHLADKCKTVVDNFSMSAWDDASKNFMSKYKVMENKVAIKYRIEKSIYDEWSTTVIDICRAVQPGMNQKGYLQDKGFTNYSFDGNRNIAFSDTKSTIVIDICRDGYMRNSPYSTATHNLNQNQKLVGLVTVMAPPPSVVGENMPDISKDVACAYRYINWWESDGVSSVLRALESIMKEIEGEDNV